MGENDKLIGRVLGGRYKIEALLGRGGFGSVYRAMHLELLRPVAIKTLLAEQGQGEDLVARFRREARLQAALRHPAIVRLLDFGREPDGLVYMVQEYVEGRTLHAYLSHRGRLEFDEASHLIARLLDGLAAAHRAGIIHRDLKPANIMLVEDHRGLDVRILDFGLAKVRDSMDESEAITRTGQILGTPAFMAPEQIEQRSISPATDIYAVGAMMYLMLVGNRPFTGSLRVVLTAHLVKPAPDLPEELPPQANVLVQRAMAKEPAQRYATAQEMLAALNAPAVPSSSTTATPDQTLRSVPPNVGIVPHETQRLDGTGPDGTIKTPSLSANWRGAIETPAEGADAAPTTHDPRTSRTVPVLILFALVGAVIAAVVLSQSGDGTTPPHASAGSLSTTHHAEDSPPQLALAPADVAADATGLTDIGPFAGPDSSSPDIGVDAAHPDAARTARERDAQPPDSAEDRRDEQSSGHEPAARQMDSSRRRTPAAPAAVERRRPAAPDTEEDVSSRSASSSSIKLLAIEQSFERALRACQCEEASRLMKRAATTDPKAGLDRWRRKHLRTCVLKATPHCK